MFWQYSAMNAIEWHDAKTSEWNGRISNRTSSQVACIVAAIWFQSFYSDTAPATNEGMKATRKHTNFIQISSNAFHFIRLENISFWRFCVSFIVSFICTRSFIRFWFALFLLGSAITVRKINKISRKKEKRRNLYGCYAVRFPFMITTKVNLAICSALCSQNQASHSVLCF